ncbi:hypothetical protein ASG89_01700 [Paenibacillus sp. Soil766]|uniref:hypothetical protein n=1 Tax=Paenibacillus sp. Soil766 TaxID=1736404 RepID=UPI00070B2F25|nr:hypothetical protein [Paenibacillus sp. Soil766]KRF10272.1 hypothetical protein ASG89_01700 [Paenibacillus sp. Soil766]
MKPKLVPLRIPSRWMISLNNFHEISTDEFTDDTYENVLELDEDILQIVSQDHKRIVDLGWYPSLNPNGQYKVKLVELVDEERQPEKWDSPLFTFSSRSVSVIKDKID